MAALIEPKDFALLLQDIDHYEGSVITQYALRIAPLVFVRPGELRHAKWQDIDLEKGLWSYTPPKQNQRQVFSILSLYQLKSFIYFLNLLK
jgi:integrase